jgi:undecaprenyl-diphosphatase
MTIFQSIILGIVQGVTEFLPISSSGHLVLTPHLLNWHIPEEQVFVFDVIVQLGTLVAVIIYFWHDLWSILLGLIVAVIIYFWHDLWSILLGLISALQKKSSRSDPEVQLGLNIIIATIPSIVIGFLLKERIEATFTDPNATALFLLFTAVLLVLAELFGKHSQTINQIKWLKSLWIGLFQALALFPGVSRSGATISGGMFGNLKRADAARFSFLMAVPAMAGAGVLAIIDLLQIPRLNEFIIPVLVGFIVSAVIGYLSIRWLLGFLVNNPLYYFSIYLVIVSAFVLLK